jgi:hypothetical protein
MRYTENTPSYNDRRYGKPWMARVTTSLTREFSFLDWDGRPGMAGQFNFDAEHGTMLAYGQKDVRKGRGGVDGYQMCMPDGSLPGMPDEWAADLHKLAPEARWRKFAQKLLDRAVAEYREPLTADTEYYRAEKQKRFSRAIKWASMLGVENPIIRDIADALNLTEQPAHSQVTSVSMEAFGL